MRNTTKKEFKEFQEEFLFWQNKLGLTEWEIFFVTENLDDETYAEIEVNNNGMAATVRMCKTLRKIDIPFFNAKENAKHEAFHLLTSPLQHLARRRYLIPTEIDEEWEKLVRRLEKVL